MKNKKILRYFIMSILLIFYNIYSAEHNSLVVGTVPQSSQDISELVQGMAQNMKQMQQDLGQIQQNMVQPQQNCQEANSDRIITGVCYFGATVIGIYLLNKFKTWASPNELDPVNKSLENIRKKVDETQKQSDEKFNLVREKQTVIQKKLVALGVDVQNTDIAVVKMYKEYHDDNAEILFSYNTAKKENNRVLEEEYSKLLRNINQNSAQFKAELRQINFEESIKKAQGLSNNLSAQEKLLNDRRDNQLKRTINNQLKIQQLNNTIDNAQEYIDRLRGELNIINFVEQTDQPQKTISYHNNEKQKGAQFFPKGRSVISNKQFQPLFSNEKQPQPLPSSENTAVKQKSRPTKLVKAEN